MGRTQIITMMKDVSCSQLIGVDFRTRPWDPVHPMHRSESFFLSLVTGQSEGRFESCFLGQPLS